MSDSDDNYCAYGTPLEPYDEDEFPKKKAPTIEDQIATDSQGRRRFHGAFTGGFSAGFCNTVGSLEGWAPAQFKSSRSDKSSKVSQRPEDFMDDEDIGEFGIAPTRVRATADYNMVSARKRKKNTTQDGPIPGLPVLELILQPAKETVGVKLLKQMGWKPGQGVGPRLTKLEKKRAKKQHAQAAKIYGCEIPASFKKTQSIDSDNISGSSSSDEDMDVTFAPDDYALFVCKPKENSFGMGYTGLDKRPVLSRFTVFDQPSHFSMMERNNKKVSISGQAFGVGAFEEDDEDIYRKDDMTQYDFELESNEKKNQSKKAIAYNSNILEGFVLAKNPLVVKKLFPAPVLPKNFIPIHGARKSRFEPLSEQKKKELLEKNKKLERTHLNAANRALILNDPLPVEQIPLPQSSKINKTTDENQSTSKKATEEVTHKKVNPVQNAPFKPFIHNLEKQDRYDKFLNFIKSNERDKLADIQPVSMTEWERCQERIEFEQASKMFKPVEIMFDRFVPAKHTDDVHNISVKFEPVESVDDDAVSAAKKKMFGKLTREKIEWKPTSLLCKRFNIPEPNIGCQPSNNDRKVNKYSVFDYLSANTIPSQKQELPEIKPEETEPEPLELNKESIPDIQQTPDTTNIIENDVVANTSNISNIPSCSNSIESPKTKLISSEKIQPIIVKNNSTLKEIKSKPPLESKLQQPTNIPIERPPSIMKVPEDPDARIDLFKAIFLSSSESESEPEDQENKNKLDKMKEILIAENKKTEEKRVEVNEKRNTDSPEGIFKNIDLEAINVRNKDIINVINNVNIKDKNVENKEINKSKEDSDIYGPQLPKQFVKVTKVDVPVSSNPQTDEWVEKDSSSDSDSSVEIKKKTKKKSHKKHKEKHKKHKSKNKHKKHKRK